MKICLLLCLATCVVCAGERVPVRWIDTPAVIGKHTVVVELKSGAGFEGKCVGATPDSFTMKVSHSHGVAKKGSLTINRSDIASIGYLPGRAGGRILGSFLGMTTGSGLGMAVNSPGGALAVAVVGAAAGYTLGSARDRTPIMFIIIP